MQLYNTEKVKEDIVNLLEGSTIWTIKPSSISLERDAKVYQDNWFSSNTASVLVREVDDQYRHFLHLDGGINTITLSLDVLAEDKSAINTIVNDVMSIMHKPNLDGNYIHIMLRSTQADHTSFRQIYRVIMLYEVKYQY